MKEPFINNMFPNNYRKPYESDFIKRTKNIKICSIYKPFYGDRYNEEKCGACGNAECIRYECEEYEENDPEFLKLIEARRQNKNKTLQDILNKLPEGITPDKVKITVNIDSNDFGVEGSEVVFSYEKEMPDDPEGYKKALEVYERNYQAYLVEKQKYDQWKKEQDINELEAKLAQLKK